MGASEVIRTKIMPIGHQFRSKETSEIFSRRESFQDRLWQGLISWRGHIKKGGWIALTEIANFFGHEPLSKRVKTILEDYIQEAYEKERYNFNVGRKLEGYLNESGFNMKETLTLGDQEFSFAGPAKKKLLLRGKLDLIG